jgi:hypothetical protein
MRALAAMIGLGLLLSPGLSFAHPLDVAALEVTVRGPAVQADLDIGLPLVFELTQLPAEQQTAAGVVAAADFLARGTLEGTAPRADGAPCPFDPKVTAEVEGIRLKLHVKATCPAAPQQLQWTLNFVRNGPMSMRVLGRADVEGKKQEFLLNPGAATLSLQGAPTVPPTFAERVGEGARWAAAGGLAALLFGLGLVLVGTWKERARALGLFVAVSAAMSMSGLQLPLRVLAAAAALSVVWLAVEGLRGAAPRWWVAAGFGVVHGAGEPRGLGFALGAALVVLGAGAVVGLLARRPLLVRILSAAILCGGVVLLVRRASG